MPLRALQRIGHAVLSMFLLTLVVFGIARVTGDPAQLILPDTATPEQVAALHAELGLDKPLVVQYWIFVGNLFHGDLGTSFRLQVPVTELISLRLPASLELGLTSLVVVLLVGIPLGVYAAYHRGTWLDGFARLVAAVGQAAPSFWIGLLLILIIGVQFGWLPAGGRGSPEQLVLPAFTMAIAGIAGVTRLVRTSMIEVLESDFVKFLRLKGVPEWSIRWKHALRNAGLAALTYVGVLTAGMLTGSVVVETVFVWPGVGQLMSDAIVTRDFAVVQGVVLVFSAIYISINLFVDLLYGVLNPRLRTANRTSSRRQLALVSTR